jgi:D-alanyl-D-alanine dipeptidase
MRPMPNAASEPVRVVRTTWRRAARVTFACLAALGLAPAVAQIPEQTQELLVVIAPDWSDLHGTAQRLVRRDHSFRVVGPPFPVVLGHNGMGWGRGLPLSEPRPGPIKHEGDGKSPAGLFALGTAFGYAPRAETTLPYRWLSPEIRCPDDASSSHYNQLVDDRQVTKDWNSAETMRRDDELYNLGVVVNHNTPASPGAGSCIFLHVWEGPDSGTVGCTAMASDDLRRLLRWLDPTARPLLLQLPKSEYRHYRARWKLPRLGI